VQGMADQSTRIPMFIGFTHCTSLPMSNPDSVATLLDADDLSSIGIGIGYWYRQDPILLGTGYQVAFSYCSNPT